MTNINLDEFLGAGITGFTGSQGVQGVQGNQGSVGFTGSQGIQGVQGVTGSTGNQGIQGVQGNQGSVGFTGSQGVQGSQGSVGFTGSRGFTGSQGVQGVQGTTGSTGSQGIQGVQGNQGSVGFTGSQGVQGIQGIQGSQGPIGYTGSQGIQGIQGSQGPIGYTGSQGIQGVQGSQGSVGFTGSRGFTGSQGIQGVQGVQGSQGPIGYTGSQGIQGIQGNQGSVGYTGSQGIQGIQGNQGPIGYTGSQGVQGVQGQQGPIGYTGSRGFTGSQGIQGIQGNQGPIGYTGSQGVQGVQGQQGPIGYTGSQGIQGVQGQQGPIGYTGSRGFTGSQGIQGSQGSVGFTGSQGIQGTAGPSTTINATEDTSATTHYPVFVAAAGSNQTARVRATATALSYVPSTGTLTATTFNGNIAGSGAISVAAGGSNQNITLTPSGTGSIVVPNGSVTAPSIRFSSDTQTGIYRSGTNQLGITTAGTQAAYFDASGNTNIAGVIGIKDALPSNNAAINSSITGSANANRYGLNNLLFITPETLTLSDKSSYAAVNAIDTYTQNNLAYTLNINGALNRARALRSTTNLGAGNSVDNEGAVFGAYNSAEFSTSDDIFYRMENTYGSQNVATIGGGTISLSVATTSGSTTATINGSGQTTNMIRVGDFITTNAAIPAGTTVATIVDTTTFTMSAAATLTQTDTSTSFTYATSYGDNVYGSNNIVQVTYSGATANKAYGVYSSVRPTTSGATIYDGYLFYGTNSTVAGTFTNRYGLYIAPAINNFVAGGMQVGGTALGGTSAAGLGVGAQPTGTAGTITMTGQLTNSVATGTAPFVISSTTRVANLNVATAGIADTAYNIFAAPSSTDAAYKIPFLNTTESVSNPYDILQDNTATFTYNPSTNTLTVANISNFGVLNLTTTSNNNITLTPNGTGEVVVVKTPSTTNTVDYPLRVERQTSGTPAANIGSGIELAAETTASNIEVGATIEAVCVDNTANSEDFDLVFKTMAAGATATEAVRVTSTNRLLLGTSTQYTSVTVTPKIQLSGSNVDNTRIGIFNWGASNGGSIQFAKSGNTTPGVYTAVSAGDDMGFLVFQGSDGSKFVTSSSLRVRTDAGNVGADFVPSRLVFQTLNSGGASTEKFRISSTGVLYTTQPAPTSKSAAATLTLAELLTGIIQYTGGSPANITLPTGTSIEGTGYNLDADMCFDFSIINTGSSNATATLTASTGVTIVGAAAVTAGTSGRFRVRKTATNTFVVYRIA